MTRQLEILNELFQILHAEAGLEYENLSCCFIPIGDEGERTAETEFVYTRQGKVFNVGISDENLFNVVELAIELQSDMKAHTGGEWIKFTLSVDESGKAKTVFDYPSEDQ
ncbi:MAG: hypothetical protein OQL20_06560 [Sedimenticola sp.]|nr:hypothetical protein [Sedimenticola sp.]